MFAVFAASGRGGRWGGRRGGRWKKSSFHLLGCVVPYQSSWLSSFLPHFLWWLAGRLSFIDSHFLALLWRRAGFLARSRLPLPERQKGNKEGGGCSWKNNIWRRVCSVTLPNASLLARAAFRLLVWPKDKFVAWCRQRRIQITDLLVCVEKSDHFLPIWWFVKIADPFF